MYCKNKAEIHQQKSKKVPMIQHDISWDIVEIWTALPQLGVFGKRGYLTEHREVQSERIWVELHKNTWLSNNFSNLRRISVNNSGLAMLIKIVSKVWKVWHYDFQQFCISAFCIFYLFCEVGEMCIGVKYCLVLFPRAGGRQACLHNGEIWGLTTKMSRLSQFWIGAQFPTVILNNFDQSYGHTGQTVGSRNSKLKTASIPKNGSLALKWKSLKLLQTKCCQHLGSNCPTRWGKIVFDHPYYFLYFLEHVLPRLAMFA